MNGCEIPEDPVRSLVMDLTIVSQQWYLTRAALAWLQLLSHSVFLKHLRLFRVVFGVLSLE